MMALQNSDVKDDGEFQTVIVTSGAQTTTPGSTPKKHPQEGGDSPDSSSRRGMHRVRSSSQLAAIVVET